jgi:hypothetical protein
MDIVSSFSVEFAIGRNQRTVGWNLFFARIRNFAIPFLIWPVIILDAFS